jgi:hypothetical protein
MVKSKISVPEALFAVTPKSILLGSPKSGPSSLRAGENVTQFPLIFAFRYRDELELDLLQEDNPMLHTAARIKSTFFFID